MTYRDVELFLIPYYDVEQLQAKLRLMRFSTRLHYETDNSILLLLTCNEVRDHAPGTQAGAGLRTVERGPHGSH